jgi:hypothetical protein
MREFAADLHAKMSEELNKLTLTSENILQRAERSYRVVESSLEELKSYIVDYAFKSKQEEIEFFKEVKPMFVKELIYFLEVFQVESWKPPVGRDEEITHYMIGAKRVDLYFKRYNDLYTYFRKGSSLHDETYFLRGNKADVITSISSSDMDPRFSTVPSFQFAKMQAYEQFSSYLQASIYRLEHPEAIIANDNNKNKPEANWTDPKVDLIELGYAIFSRGSVNNGKADIKLIISALEYAFNVSLGHFYAVFQQNIRIRKKNRTIYMDSAKEHLERRMDDWDLRQ